MFPSQKQQSRNKERDQKTQKVKKKTTKKRGVSRKGVEYSKQKDGSKVFKKLVKPKTPPERKPSVPVFSNKVRKKKKPKKIEDIALITMIKTKMGRVVDDLQKKEEEMQQLIMDEDMDYTKLLTTLKKEVNKDIKKYEKATLGPVKYKKKKAVGGVKPFDNMLDLAKRHGKETKVTKKMLAEEEAASKARKKKIEEMEAMLNEKKEVKRKEMRKIQNERRAKRKAEEERKAKREEKLRKKALEERKKILGDLADEVVEEVEGKEQVEPPNPYKQGNYYMAN